MFCPRVDGHEPLAGDLEPLEDLACGFLLQLSRHVGIAPQRAEVGQVAPRRLQRFAIRVADQQRRAIQRPPGAGEGLEDDEGIRT